MRHLAVVVVLVLALVGGAAPAGAADPALPDLDVIDPVEFSYGDAIVEQARVSTQTGAQIWVDVIRPDTTDQVPAIMMSSPYYNTLGRGWRGERKIPTTETPLSPFVGPAGPLTRFPEWYDEYFVPRGYAFVAMDLRGTRNSSGCQTYGDRDEILDTVSVIDWIADQPWSNDKVAMTGGSYDGTIAIGAAAEMPISGRNKQALAAITPIRAIDRWYDYHFFNGVQSSSHQLTAASFTVLTPPGDEVTSELTDPETLVAQAERASCVATFGPIAAAGYASPYQDAAAPFWSERDFLKDAAGMNTAIFLLHGQYDYNVKTNNAGHLWEALPDALPRKLWLFNGDHVDPHVPTVADAQAGSHIMPFPFQDAFVEATHRWFLQFLKGVEAGALATPEFAVQRADGRFVDGGAFPAAGTDQALSFTPTGTLTGGTAPAGTLAYRDGNTGQAPTSVVLASEPFAAATRLSGQLAFDLDLAATGFDTTIAVTVLDVPPGTAPGATPTTDLDNGTSPRPLRISHAWLRTAYRDDVRLRGASTPTGTPVPLTPGQRTSVQFPSLYLDHVIPAGHRLALRIANNAGGTVAANTGGDVTLFTGADGSRVLLPVAPLAADDQQAPEAVIPESPVAALPALLGLALLGWAVARRRREPVTG